MSHLQERKQKNCLNCGTQVAGRYCQQCGQENVEVKESFWHLIMHFIEDITHFDGKLWKTLKLLLFKPAKLTQYYMDGKRASYIHPIRMYLFISAVFFFFLFSNKEAISSKDKLKEQPLATTASSNPNKGLKTNLGEDSVQYKTIAAYDSAQHKLSAAKRNNWLESIIIKKSIELNVKYEEDAFKIGQALFEQFQHYFSRMLYISLPLFSLCLWVLYRRNKHHYFVDHLIFSIHIYCAFFIFLFALYLWNSATLYFLHTSFAIADVSVTFLLFYYLYKSLKNHFNQSRFKTIAKFVALNLLTILFMGILMLVFILLSLFNI